MLYPSLANFNAFFMDVNGDGLVNVTDLLITIANWG